MTGDEENIGTAPENLLCAVAMVYVKIDNGYPIRKSLSNCPFCGNGSVVEQAESHGAIPGGVVAGRSCQAEARPDSPFCDWPFEIPQFLANNFPQFAELRMASQPVFRKTSGG